MTPGLATQKLFEAARSGDVSAARVALDAGADVTATDKAEQTPLHLAAMRGHIGVARLLIENGADPNAKDHRQQTPLDLADLKRHNRVAQLLIAKMADHKRERQGSASQPPVHDNVTPAKLLSTSPAAREGIGVVSLLLTDDEWNCIADLFGEPAVRGRPQVDRRKIFNGVLWILKAGSPWRDLPKRFGKWQTAWRLFDQWRANGTLDAALQRLDGRRRPSINALTSYQYSSAKVRRIPAPVIA
jgi:transposase